MNIKVKELVGTVHIYLQKKLKDDAMGFTKYMGDGIWKMKLRSGVSLEELIDTCYHEFSEFLFCIVRPESVTKKCNDDDHTISTEIANKASTKFMKQVWKGDIKKRFKGKK